ncbi:MAG: FAD-dependent thymidylate synthase, partial [Planctomycetota bacterium]
MSQELHVNPEYPIELPYRRVLDHGFVALVDVMGEDSSIVQAARVSYGKGTKTVRSDKALISYLARHKHCYDEETEVLTDQGFVKWPEVTADMRLGIWDPSAETLCYERPNYITRHPYSGPMYRVDHGGVDLLVTPDHKMYVCLKEWDRDRCMSWEPEHRLIRASDLGDRSTVSYCKLAPYRTDGWQAEDFPSFRSRDALLNLIGFFVGDGCARGTRANGIDFHLKKPREIEFLADCVERTGWEMREFKSYGGRRKFAVYGERIGDLFRETFYENRKKRLPAWALKLGCDDAESLMLGLRNSDGTEKRGACEYATTHRHLAEQVQRLALHAGHAAHINTRNNGMHGVMMLSRMEHPVVNQGKVQTSMEDYSGTVYCANTRTGIMVVRRNGKIVLSGNTTPFEMIEFKFLMRLPVFIARQVVRHRTASINEYSGRYSLVPDRFWVPDLGAIADQDAVNRQGRSDLLLELA